MSDRCRKTHDATASFITRTVQAVIIVNNSIQIYIMPYDYMIEGVTDSVELISPRGITLICTRSADTEYVMYTYQSNGNWKNYYEIINEN